MALGPALSRSFEQFFESEKAAGIVLVACTAVALALANSAAGERYAELWHLRLGGLTLEHWINDGLMAVFFLLIGLELERELYSGELSEPRKALLPLFAALGGMAAPALIHLALNAGTPAQAGIGIPMATDIAFALGVLALLGRRIPAALKVVVVAFAVMDDLGAIVLIATFYSGDVSLLYLGGACGAWLALVALNRAFRVMALWPYLLGGAAMWALLLQSGVHATLAGVALAFAIPFTAKAEDEHSPSHRLESALHRPVAFFVLPLFALANAGVALGGGWLQQLASASSAGIFLGLVLGKPLGVLLLSYAAVRAGWCRLPPGLQWRHVAGAGLLGGIGFTMSIFITNLAFSGDPAAIAGSKLAILAASLTAGALGYAWLRFLTAQAAASGVHRPPRTRRKGR